ncbi:MAG: 4-hydroxythreonine-4-phosphate dehydrogenase PdxA [Deferribacteraceae bacterium]|nr:4-hydroxythreonine-4-phosphate dehydrogenase PdxA [Deferribacteraceae bacterium]
MGENIRIGVTVGDPAGIGPEITAKLLSDTEFYAAYPFIPVAPESILDDAFKNILKIAAPDYEILKVAGIPAFKTEYGKHDPRYGDISMKSVKTAVESALAGKLDAVVTCPINKHSVALAGYPFPGHTEYLGHLTGSPDFSMMMASERVKVVLATTHLPLKDVSAVLTVDKVLKAIRNAHKSGVLFGKPEPEVAVCGLNPHAGDKGSLGDEELSVIEPAILKARSEGINAAGPYPSDTLFAHTDRFDIAVAMYHDQGLIPVKMDGFGKTVNITLNIPIMRVSVDHGTAFDIAGKGLADPGSLKNAIKTAYKMVLSRADVRAD